MFTPTSKQRSDSFKELTEFNIILDSSSLFNWFPSGLRNFIKEYFLANKFAKFKTSKDVLSLITIIRVLTRKKLLLVCLLQKLPLRFWQFFFLFGSDLFSMCLRKICTVHRRFSPLHIPFFRFSRMNHLITECIPSFGNGHSGFHSDWFSRHGNRNAFQIQASEWRWNGYFTIPEWEMERIPNTYSRNRYAFRIPQVRMGTGMHS